MAIKQLTEKKVTELKLKLQDEDIPLEEKRLIAKKMMDSILNPQADAAFNPDTFDPDENEQFHEARKRGRSEPPRRLPDMDMWPREPFVGQLIGQFENKQDLYLLIAWLSNRMSDLEDEVERLRGG